MLCFFICLVKDKTFPSFIKSSNIKVMSKIGQSTSRFGFSTSGQQRLLYACWKPPQINIFEAFLGSSVDRIPTSYPATALKSGKFRCLIKTWITTTTKPSRKGLLDALFLLHLKGRQSDQATSPSSELLGWQSLSEYSAAGQCTVRHLFCRQAFK